jgi:hypothetical protein
MSLCSQARLSLKRLFHQDLRSGTTRGPNIQSDFTWDTLTVPLGDLSHVISTCILVNRE